MNPKVKTAIWLGTFTALGVSGVVRMTHFPKPGLTGGPPPGEAPLELRVMAERLEQDVLFQCEDIGRRTSRFSVLDDQFREWMEFQIRTAGLHFESQEYEILHKKYYNLIGTKPGRVEGAVVIATHYDSYGKSPCANASATGVATVLEAMRSLSREDLNKTLIVCLFGTGEKPHSGRESMGAQRWVNKAIEDGLEIEMAFAVGSFGAYRYGEGTQNSTFPWYLMYPDSGEWTGIYGSFVGKSTAVDVVNTWADVTELPARGFAAPSWMPGIPAADQVPFQDAGIPAVIFTDTSGERDAHLRSSSDIPYTINYEEMARRVQAFTAVVEKYADA